MAILTQVNQWLQKFPYFFCEQLAVQGIGLTEKKNLLCMNILVPSGLLVTLSQET